MRKTFFLLIALCVLLVFSGTAIANTEGGFDEALKYYYGGKYDRAYSILKDYVKKRPDPAAYYLAGYALYKMKKFDESTEFFNEAYLIDPNFSPDSAGLPKRFPKDLKEAKKKTVAKKRPASAKKKAEAARPAQPEKKATPPAQGAKEAAKPSPETKKEAPSKPAQEQKKPEAQKKEPAKAEQKK